MADVPVGAERPAGLALPGHVLELRDDAVTRDAFRRLALLAACSGYVVALGLVWIHVHPVVAALGFLGGVVLAIATTLEATPDMPPAPVNGAAGLGHRAIGRRARAARGDDD